MKPNLSLLTLVALGSLTASSAQAQWSFGSLSVPRSNVAVVTVGDLVLFAGGISGFTAYDTVDIYDSRTRTWSTETLSLARSNIAATALGDLAFFAGGTYGQAQFTDIVDVFDTQSMTWGSSESLSQARHAAGATTVGTKAFFAGGQQVLGSTSARVDIYDASIGIPSDPAAWSTVQMSRRRAQPTAVTAADRAVFAGGWLAPGGVPVADVDIYDDSTGTWSTAMLSEARILGPYAAAAVGTCAVFGGGHTSPMGGPSMSDVVDVYDAATGQWSDTTLSAPRGYMGVTAVGNRVLFAGGTESGFFLSDLVEIFNVGSGQWGATATLSQARRGLAAATVAGVAMFAGGAGVNGSSSRVDTYEPLGVTYCTPTANSTGNAADISASGSGSVTANDLTLHGTSLPSNSFGYFLASPSKGHVANPGGSNGVLCLGGSIGRYVGAGQIQNSGSGGTISLLLDLSTTPTPNGLVAVQVGETWNFQAWHRDLASTSNFTDAISVTFR